MRRSILIAIVVSFVLATPALSGNLGPVKPALSKGDKVFSLGYNYTESKWEDDGPWENLKLKQHQFFAQAGYSLIENWVGYLRGGISYYDANNAFLYGSKFEGENVVPFVTAGANGVFFENEIISIGPFAQGSYYFSDNDDTNRFQIATSTGPETVKEKVTFDEMWEARVGLGAQVELEGAQLYGGLMYYISEADIESKIDQSSGSSTKVTKTVQEENHLGFVVGVQWPLIKDVTLDIEAELRSRFDIGLMLNKRF